MNELDKLFIKYGTDKSSIHHNYSENYETHFSKFRGRDVKMLVLGIGGYEFPDRGGGDLKAFSDYFYRNNAKIYGVDIYDKSKIKFPSKVKTFVGSQNDGNFLTKVLIDLGEPDIILDDASHMNKLTIESFKHLFPWLKSGGVYVIEDLETSWYEDSEYGGTKNFMDMNYPSTINFLREILNVVNIKFLPNEAKSVYQIASIHFYQNIAFIVKK